MLCATHRKEKSKDQNDIVISQNITSTDKEKEEELQENCSVGLPSTLRRDKRKRIPERQAEGVLTEPVKYSKAIIF